MGRKRKIRDLVTPLPGPIQLVFPEEWKLITGNEVENIREGYYMISSYGRVYSCKTNSILNQVISNTGYYRVFLRLNDGTGRYYSVHRILMKVFCPNEYCNQLQVNHKNGDKLYNTHVSPYNQRFNNLEWCTCQENIIHSINTNLKPIIKGEDCSYANITNEQADKIAFLLSTGNYSHKEISELCDCPLHTVNGISSGNIWKDYYNKYNLKEHKRKFSLNLSDEQLHLLFKYFEDNSYKYVKRNDLYKNALNDLFGIQYTNQMSATMSRLYNRATRTNISSQYNF